MHHLSLTRRRVAAALGAGLVAFSLGACQQGSATRDADSSPSGSAGGETTITYMNFSANDGHENDLAGVVTAFEEANPGIKVQVETIPYADYFTKLQTALAGGTASDAFELNYESFVTYAASGALAPLSGIDAAAYKPSLLDAFASDGTQYGLPESFSDVVLYYNKDLFDAKGIAYPTADWTWADEKAAADQLTDKASGVWGDYQPISFHEFYKALAQAGGEFFNADQSATAFDSPEGIAAANWLIGKSGTSMPTEADGAGTPDFDTNLFKEGKLALWHSGIWMFSGLAETAGLNWDIVVEPGDTTKASAMFANGVVINAKSTKAEAATKWLEFLTASDYSTTMRIDTGWELPPIADESKMSGYLDLTPPDNREAVFDSLDHIVLPPVIERQQEMQDAVTEELGNAAAGRKSVEQALSDAAATVDGLLD